MMSTPSPSGCDVARALRCEHVLHHLICAKRLTAMLFKEPSLHK